MDNRIGYTSENLKAVVDKLYQMPRFLDNPEFSTLSTYAKMLYIYLLDRLKLSLSSNWSDEENGQIYMYYKREEMQKALKLTAKTVKKVVDELKTHNLMSEKVQGINLPNRIFLYAQAESNSDYANGHGKITPMERENLQARTGRISPLLRVRVIKTNIPKMNLAITRGIKPLPAFLQKQRQ